MFKSKHLNSVFSSFLFVIVLLLGSMLYSSCKTDSIEDNIQAQTEATAPNSELVQNYLKEIEAAKAEGHSVFFQTPDNSWVENPSAEWLNGYVKESVMERAGNYFQAKIQILTAKFEYFSIHCNNSGTVLSNLSNCLQENNTYYSLLTAYTSTSNNTVSIFPYCWPNSACNKNGKYILTVKFLENFCVCNNTLTKNLSYNYNNGIITPQYFSVPTCGGTTNECIE